MRPWAAALAALCCLSCGDGVRALRVDLVVEGNPDPMQEVARLRLIASGPPPMAAVETEAPREARQLELPPIPLGPQRVITVEGLDLQGVLTARGQSEPFELSSSAPRSVAVRFASCETVLYRDSDDDGHGDGRSPKSVCAGSLTGYVGGDGDCDDADPDAFPGQTDFFERPTLGTRTFDFDCDGAASPEHPELSACRKEPPDCGGQGWQDSVPACGETGIFVDCDKGNCDPLPPTEAVQRCR